MTSSSSGAGCGLDAMLIVYSLLDGHPAASACEDLIRSRDDWFTPSIALFEAKAVLTKIYAVDAASATRKLAVFADGPVVVVPVDGALARNAMHQADLLNIDLTDALLLEIAVAHGATSVATEDRKFARACNEVGIAAISALDADLRRQVTEWENARIPAKGLARILFHVHGWLVRNHTEAAEDFWSHTRGGSHLP
jgi:predicted nucleic acid-binding protein